MVEFARWERRVELSDLVGRLRALLAGGAAGGAGGAATGGGGQSRRAPASPAAPAAGAPQTRAAGASSAAAIPAQARAAAGAVPDWTGFVEVVMQTNPGLASCLMTGLPEVDLAGGRLAIAFEPENAFMLKQIAHGQEALAGPIASVFGKPLRLELTLVDAGAGPSRDEQEAVRRHVAPTDVETLARERRDDPQLDRLVDMVRGEPVAEAELERWQTPPSRSDDTDTDR